MLNLDERIVRALELKALAAKLDMVADIVLSPEEEPMILVASHAGSVAGDVVRWAQDYAHDVSD